MLDDLNARISTYESATKIMASGIAKKVGAKTALRDLIYIFVQEQKQMQSILFACRRLTPF